MGKRSWRIAALTVAGVVVAGGGAGTAYAAMSSSGPAYRLATVTSADETASLLEVGTLSPVQQADVAFSASGTVQRVLVRAGQYVTAGQALGSLDTTSLKASLASAQSTLAQANLQVDNDIASQNNAADTTGAGSAGTAAASHPVSSLGPLQQEVLSAQRQVDSALAQAKTALAQAKQACATTPSPSPSPSPSPTAAPQSPSPTTAPDQTAATTLPATTTGDPSPPTCADATQRVLDAETAVLQAQQALSGRLSALENALSTDAGSPAGGGGSGGSGPAGGSGPTGGSTPVSAAQLAADQASADAAAAQVTVAEQGLAAATVVSPVSGTVTEVNVTPGTSAAAGSTAFEITGLNSFQVLTSVPVTDMPELKVGEPASVQPDGVSTPVSGSVVSIGLMPDTSQSPPTYPVTIGLTGQPSGLHPGGYASVTIVTARGSGVSVPTSAVHYSGSKATVTVYAGGKPRVTKVKVGTRGPVMTQITSGLRIGQQVVLANLNAPLPNNNPNDQGPGSGVPILIGGPGGGVSTFVGQGGPGG
jgi:multidrug efflux pump subunit AcrA (membrane-fusion protein)